MAVMLSLAVASGDVVQVFLSCVFLVQGALFGWITAAFVVNRTTIRVTDNELSIQHRPVPTPGNRVLSTEALCQFRARRSDGDGRTLWELCAETHGPSLVVLVRNLEREQAEYLAEVLAEHLDLGAGPLVSSGAQRAT